MKLIQFLSGINPSYDQVKVNILSIDPPPTLNRAYHILQQVERQNPNSISHLPHCNSGNVSALHVGSSSHSGGNTRSQPPKRDFKKAKLDRF